MASKSAAVAKRYSRALWLLGRTVEEAEAWVGSLESFAKALESSKDLQHLIQSPAFTLEQKTKVVDSILEAQKTPEALKNFLKTVLTAGRMPAINEIVEAYRQRTLESRHSLEAIVETAFPLAEPSLKKLTSHLEKICGKKLTVKVKIVPDLLAGLRVKVGGKTLDFTFTAQLNKLERWLHQAQA